jgi:hypothetical protein
MMDGSFMSRFTVPGLTDAQGAELEKFQWLIRAHLEDAGGSLVNAGATTEKAAARSAVDAA